MRRGFRSIKGGICIETIPETGVTLQEAIRLAQEGRQDLVMGAPILQTAANEINPAYDIRTDRFELAQAAAEKAGELRVFEKAEKAKEKGDEQAKTDSVTDATKG